MGSSWTHSKNTDLVSWFPVLWLVVFSNKSQQGECNPRTLIWRVNCCSVLMMRANPPEWAGPWIRNLLAIEAGQKNIPGLLLLFPSGGVKSLIPRLNVDKWLSVASFWKQTWEEQLADGCNHWLVKSSLCICLEICAGALTANCLSVLISSLCKVSIFPVLHQRKWRRLSRNLITSPWQHFRRGRQSYHKYLIEYSA